MADKATQDYLDLAKAMDVIVGSSKKVESQLKSNLEIVKALSKQQKELSTALKQSGGAKEFANVQKQVATNIKNTALAEKELIKVESLRAKENEKLAREVLKTKTAQEKAATASKKLNGEYQKASRRLTELRNKAKEVALQFGLNSKEFKRARKEVVALDKRLKQIDASLGQNQREVGRYQKAWQGLQGAFFKITGVIAAARGAIKLTGDVIKSTQTSGDAFTISVEKWTAGWDAFKKSIATNDFDDLIERIKQAAAAGEEYAKILDDLGDRQRTLTLVESEAKIATEQLKQVIDNVNLSNKERLTAAEEVLNIEQGLLEQRKSVAKQEFDAESQRLAALTGLSEEQILAFIRNYDEEKELRERAIELIEAEDRVRKISSDLRLATSQTESQILSQQLESAQNNFKNLNEGASESVKQYAEIFKGYGKTTDEELDRVTQAYKKFLDAQSQFFTGTRRSQNQYNTLLKQLNKEVQDNTSIVVGNTEQLQTRGDIALDTEFKIQGALKETTRVFEDAEKAKTKIAQEEAERRKELQFAITEASFESLNMISDQFFTNSQIRRDNETQAEIDALNTRLENETLDQEQRDEIQKQIDKKERALKTKKAKADKRAAIIQSVINTALSIGKTAATLGFPAAIPFIAFAAITGAVQQALIASQPIPKFDKGTKNFPGLGEVAEKRPEFIKHNGNVELFTQPTLLGSEYKGAEVISGQETARMLDNINRGQVVENLSNYSPIDQQMISIAVGKEFGKHADRMIAEMKNNRPKQSSFDNYKKTRDYIKKHAE